MEAIDMPARSRWTKPRLIEAAVLFGRGCDAEEIARATGSHARYVRDVFRRFGWAFVDRPPGNLTIDVPAKLLIVLEGEALRRRKTPEALVSAAVSILADDPTLLANVLDDEA